jgi:transcriptional regulator of arginine metabolism
MRRLERQNALLRLVRGRELSTQAEVAAALRDEGFDVVQTTVSRDLGDLGLVKVRAPSGRLVYAPPVRATATGCERSVPPRAAT